MAVRIPSGPLILGRGGGLQVKASSAAAFTPASLSGLQVWYDATQIVSTDGTALGTWSDVSGNGRNATQATGANKPIYKTGIQNSLPVVRCGASPVQYVQAATWGTLAQPNTVVVVGSVTSTFGYLVDGGDSTNRHSIARGLNTNGSMGLYAGSVIEGVQALSEWHTWIAVVNGGSSVLYRDGSSFATGNANTRSLAGITIGCRNDGGAGNAGADIGEVIVYTGAMGSTDRSSLQTYLKAKWGTP